MDEEAPQGRFSLPTASGLFGAGRQIVRGATDLLFPPLCPLTGDPVARAGTLSAKGWAGLSHLARPWCPRCGTPVPIRLEPAPACEGCEADDALYGGGQIDRWRSAVLYDEAVARAVLGLKYGHRFDGVSAFARLMAVAGGEALPLGAVLMPVPLHPARLRQRQFNQAQILAAALGRLTGHSVAPNGLRRIRRTQTMQGKNRRDRARNVANAFAAPRPLDPAVPIVLIDDVLTTGATLKACARALRQGGARRINAVTLARVALHEDDAI